MSKHEFSKIEIATYLRDMNRLMMYSIVNQNTSFWNNFKFHMNNDQRLQYSISDYYTEMINIYEFFLVSKFLTMRYDNYFNYLQENSIDKMNIPPEIFVNKNDSTKFSKKQIIKFIRNAFNHNDNQERELYKIIRVNEKEKDIIKIEINLKNTKPVPFHVVIDLEQLMVICHELQKSSTFFILSNRSLTPIDINSKNVNDMLNNMFVRKFYSIKKLTEEQKIKIRELLENNKSTKNNEHILQENGMTYKDFYFSIAQKIKIQEDLSYWESIGIRGNDVISHLISKVIPLSVTKDRMFAINLILVDCYMKDSSKSVSNFMRDALNILRTNKLNEETNFSIYFKSFGYDNKLMYDALDLDNIASLTYSIFYGYLFDSLVTDDEIKIASNKEVKREKIRDSFVHMRWFMGINECYKLFDWGNCLDDELNRKSNTFWSTNIKLSDMEKCAESYFQYNLLTCRDQEYMNLPIHFKKYTNKNGVSQLDGISFVKNGIFYYLDVKEKDDLKLLVFNGVDPQRDATDEEIEIFLDELDLLSNEEKRKYNELISDISLKLNKKSNHPIKK